MVVSRCGDRHGLFRPRFVWFSASCRRAAWLAEGLCPPSPLRRQSRAVSRLKSSTALYYSDGGKESSCRTLEHRLGEFRRMTRRVAHRYYPLAVALAVGLLVVVAAVSTNTAAAALQDQQEEKTLQEEAAPQETEPSAVPAEQAGGAAEEAAPAQPQGASEGDVQPQPAPPLLVWVYRAAGIFFWPQLALSVLVVSMIVLYSLQTRRENFLPDRFVREFEERLKQKRYQEAYDLARSGTSYLERVLAAGLGQLSAGYRAASEAMDGVAEEEDLAYEHRLSYLSMLANVATMVGLLGTVWGMVAAFRQIAVAAVAPKPSELANDVSMALITTVWGLLQAIPAVVAYTILRNRVTRLALEVQNERERLMARFASVRGRSRSASESSGSEG